MTMGQSETSVGSTPLRKKDSLFDEGFLIIITGLGNVFSFYFQIYMSRNLSQGSFSELVSIMAMVFWLSIPVIAIQPTITKFVAQLNARDENAKVRRLFLESLKHVSLLAFVLMSLIIMGSPLIGEFLHIQKNIPIIISGLLLFTSYCMPVFWAILQGRERFGFLGMSYFVAFAAKCGLGILFVVIGWGVGGALLGITLSFLPALVIAGWPIRETLAPVIEDDRVKMKEIYSFGLPVVLALLPLNAFQLDVPLVRHFYGQSAAGILLADYYARAQIVGKAFYFLPMGIVLALFPKVARKKATGENTVPVLIRGLILEIVLSLVGIIGCVVFARYIALFLGKTDAPELVMLIRVFGVAITPVAATTVLVNYNLANERYGFIWMLVPLTLLTFAGVWLFHATPMTVLLMIASGGFLLLISISAYTFAPRKAGKPGAEIQQEVAETL